MSNSSTIDGIFVKTVPGVKTFRRAGMAFNEHGIGIALDALSDEQLDQLENEDNLIVERVSFSDNESELLTRGELVAEAMATEPNYTTTSADGSANHDANPGAGGDPAPDARIAQLVEAIGQLEEGNQDHWTKSGKPDASTLSERLGFRVSAAERDAAWALVEVK